MARTRRHPPAPPLSARAPVRPLPHPARLRRAAPCADRRGGGRARPPARSRTVCGLVFPRGNRQRLHFSARSGGGPLVPRAPCALGRVTAVRRASSPRGSEHLAGSQESLRRRPPSGPRHRDPRHRDLSQPRCHGPTKRRPTPMPWASPPRRHPCATPTPARRPRRCPGGAGGLSRHPQPSMPRRHFVAPVGAHRLLASVRLSGAGLRGAARGGPGHPPPGGRAARRRQPPSGRAHRLHEPAVPALPLHPKARE